MKQRINVTNSKLYAHAYRCTNSTTANFSYVQPLMCRMLMAHSKIKGKLNIFARLAAMPRPTFGKINLETHISFVPIEQIYPSFMSLMSELPYTNSKGVTISHKKLPCTRISDLYKALTYAVSSYDVAYTSHFKVTRGPSSARSAVTAMSFDEFNTTYGDVIEAGETPTISNGDITRPLFNPLAEKAVMDYRTNAISKDEAERVYARSISATPTDISPANLDVINGRYDFIEVSSAASNAYDTLVCIVLTDRGKALRKLFLGLGYNVSFDDDTSVSILPLLAYYKAYYDFAVPFRDAPFESTKCYSLIRFIDEHPDFVFSYENANEGGSEGDALFSSFIREELSQCFSVQDINWLSLHTSDIINGRNHFENYPLSTAQPTPNVATDITSNYANGEINTSPDSPGAVDITTYDTFNALSVKLLLKMYGYYGRDSIIGNRINLWAKAHLNSDVYNSLFASCNSINHASSMIQIGDIDATAGTRQTDGTGNVLGDYAGKGIGSQSVKYNYKTDVYGFFIVFQWVNPVTSYYQGTDSQLCALTKYDLPQAEFDALGFELTPRSCVWTDNGISLRGAKHPDTIHSDKTVKSVITDNDAFGFVPRYSGFKNAKNIVNGDFSLRSLRSSMSCFYLDREFDVRHLDFLHSADGSKVTYTGVNLTWLPYASEQWRYIQRYPWLGNYNRIFVNSDNFKFDPIIENVSADLLGTYPWPMDDNFMLHCVFDFTEDTPLKPLSQSFETQVKANDSESAVTPA